MPEYAYIFCMDTIIYFYLNRELGEPAVDVRTGAGAGHGNGSGTGAGAGYGNGSGTGAGIESMPEPGMQGREYTLIRVGFNLSGELWFGQNAGQAVPEELQALLEAEEPEMPCKKGIFGWLRRIRRERAEMRRRVERQFGLEQALAAREERLGEIERQMRGTAERILKGTAGKDGCRYACEEGLKKCPAWQLWLKYFPVKEFDGYLQGFWVRQLLPHAAHPRLVLLGSCEGICALIESRAPRLKSVEWILKEQECTPEIMDFVEEFCEEYGLAIALRTVPGRTAYRRLRLDCPEPADILDFTEETGFLTSGVAKGSVWLDMASSEEKRHRIAGRDTGIRYFSLKEGWRRG